jgi:hypothetical protein
MRTGVLAEFTSLLLAGRVIHAADISPGYVYRPQHAEEAPWQPAFRTARHPGHGRHGGRSAPAIAAFHR